MKAVLPRQEPSTQRMLPQTRAPERDVAWTRAGKATLSTCTAALTVLVGGCNHLFGPTASALGTRPGFAWKSAEIPQFRFYFEPQSYAERHLGEIERNMQAARARVLTLLAEPAYADEVTVFVVGSRARMRTLIGRETNGQALPKQNVILLVVSDSINASGAHELMHVIAKNRWGEAEDWINEGLAIYADDIWMQQPLHAVTRYLLSQGRLVPLPQLINHFGDYDELVTYPEAGSFLKFLYEQHGVDKVKAVWKGGAAVMPRTMEQSIQQLEGAWHTTIALPRQPNEC